MALEKDNLENCEIIQGDCMAYLALKTFHCWKNSNTFVPFSCGGEEGDALWVAKDWFFYQVSARSESDSLEYASS